MDLLSKKYAQAKEIAENKAENDKLKEEIKEVKKYQYQQEYLDKEIEEMQKALKTLAEGLNKRQMILQKIKAIAERAINGEYKTKSSDYSEGMEIIGHYVMQKITKAEEE